MVDGRATAALVVELMLLEEALLENDDDEEREEEMAEEDELGRPLEEAEEGNLEELAETVGRAPVDEGCTLELGAEDVGLAATLAEKRLEDADELDAVVLEELLKRLLSLLTCRTRIEASTSINDPTHHATRESCIPAGMNGPSNEREDAS